jgi:hypothetical protein
VEVNGLDLDAALWEVGRPDDQNEAPRGAPGPGSRRSPGCLPWWNGFRGVPECSFPGDSSDLTQVIMPRLKANRLTFFGV